MHYGAVGEVVGEMGSKIVSQLCFYPPQGSPCKQLTSALSLRVLSFREIYEEIGGGGGGRGGITFIIVLNELNPGIMSQ